MFKDKSGFCIQYIYFFPATCDYCLIKDSKKWLSSYQKRDIAQGLSVLHLGSLNHVYLLQILPYQPPHPFIGGFFPLTKRKMKELRKLRPQKKGPFYSKIKGADLFISSEIIMHLSMLRPRVGAGYPREIDLVSFSLGGDFDI